VDDLDAMAVALDEARSALDHGDVPIGAVVVVNDRIVARRHNEREATGDPTAHAECSHYATRAASVGDGWRLGDATLYVTIEPCPMCAGAALAARLARVVFGAPDPKAGACGSLYNVCTDPRLHHEMAVTAGIRSDDAAALVTAFFASKRDGATPTGQ